MNVSFVSVCVYAVCAGEHLGAAFDFSGPASQQDSLSLRTSHLFAQCMVKEWQERGVDGGEIQFRWDVEERKK